MRRTVDDFMALPYTIEIVPDEDGYFARVRELEGCMTVGTSKEDALAMLEDAMREWLRAALDDNLEIPLPGQKERYSGKFPLRLPKSLHRRLSEAAEEDGVSLNHYLVMLLAENHALARMKKLLAREQDMGRPTSTNPLCAVSEPAIPWAKGEKKDPTQQEKRKRGDRHD